MISKTDIENTLIILNAKHAISTNHIETLMYAKLALLELCGWIELSMDDLIRRCAAHNLSKNGNIKHIEDVVIKYNYGFEYKKHFRNMLCSLIGLITFEKIELKADQQKLQNLKSALGNLKEPRNKEAHTFTAVSYTHLTLPSMCSV